MELQTRIVPRLDPLVVSLTVLGLLIGVPSAYGVLSGSGLLGDRDDVLLGLGVGFLIVGIALLLPLIARVRAISRFTHEAVTVGAVVIDKRERTVYNKKQPFTVHEIALQYDTAAGPVKLLVSVKPERYDALATGTALDVRYAVSQPRLALLQYEYAPRKPAGA